jgi:CheY-like chemotaxis protein
MDKRQTILIVDDSENDIFLMHRAFKKAEFDCPLREVYDGEQAIAYLAGEGAYNDRNDYPMPSIVLLDLNMPKKNGFDVLAWARAQAKFKRLSIIVMTASMRPDDVERAFDLGASSFLLKPSNTTALTAMVQCLRDWSRQNHFPPFNEMVRR